MENLTVRFKKLHKDTVIPTYAHEDDAGADLTAVSESIVEQKGYGYIEYDTQLAVEIPKGYVGLIYPRSSISKKGLILANAVPVIDSNYRGSIKLRFKYVAKSDKYKIGDRIAQLMIVPYPKITYEEVEELGDSDRGNKGFGSTDSK